MTSISFPRLLTVAAWLSVLAMGVLSRPALAAEDPANGPRTLTLRGEGQASAAPDLAWLRIGVDTQAPQARDALSANAAAMVKVVAALKGDGLADRDVQTSDLSVVPLYSDDPKKPRVVTGYQVGNLVTVRIRDLSRTGPIIDQVVALGSNDIAALRFDVDDPSAAQNKARAAAVGDAIAKAKLYASAAGVVLGPIMKIAEEPTANFAPMGRQFAAAAVGGSTPIASGELTFHAVVDMTWRLQ